MQNSYNPFVRNSGAKGGDMVVTVITTILLSFNFAQAQVSVQKPKYGGSGCPQGSASAKLSANKKVLTVEFDEYEAHAGKSSGKSIDRKTCNLIVPVKVSPGYRVGIPKVEFSGAVQAPSGTTAQIKAEYFVKSFSGESTGPSISKTYVGPKNGNFSITGNTGNGDFSFSDCGEDVNLRVNSSVLVRSNSKKSNVGAAVDRARITYALQWEKC